MNAAGSWKVTASTPVGPQVMDLHIVTQGERFTGRIESPMGDLDIAGSAKGNALNWVMEITKPMSMKVTFDVVVDGDTMSGTAKMGFLGKAKLTGERMAAGAPSADSPGHQSAPAGPVTADSIDPQFNEPYVEVNELRNEPVPHRYVHGGFKGTDARFSFYFPPRIATRDASSTTPIRWRLTSDIGPFPIAFDVAIGDLGFTIAQRRLLRADESGRRRSRASRGSRDRRLSSQCSSREVLAGGRSRALW